jgi:oligopeptide transport system substrate-binding protein
MRPGITVAPLVVVLLLASLLSGPARVTAQNGPIPHVLRVNWGDPPPDTLDPQLSHSGQWGISGGVDFEGLTKLDEELQPVPGAAESWEFSPDGKTITFHLREGLVFSDGVPVTAEHFVYAAQRLCGPELNTRSAMEFFAVVGCEELFTSLDDATGIAAEDEITVAAAEAQLGVRAVDERTLEYRFEKPAPYFLVLAARWRAIPLRQDLIEAGGPEWWANPATRIGNGPFKLVEYQREAPNQRLVFARNDRYWDGPPKLDRLEYHFADIESPAKLEAYRNGEYDIMWLDQTMYQEIEGDPVLSQEVVTLPIAGTAYFAFNLTREPFTDPKVREAFAYTFDREALCRQLSFGTCRANLGWVSPGVPGYIETEAFAFDPQKARAALAASSYGGPENLPPIDWYIIEGEAGMAEDAEWFSAQLRDTLGVELNVVTVSEEEFDAMYEDLTTTPPLHTSMWYAGPEIRGWFAVWRCGSAFNDGYCNPRYDALVDRADAELDPAKRLQLYEAAHRLLLADTPAIFISSASSTLLVKPSVVGYSRTTPNEFWPGFTNLLTVDVVASG